MTKILDISSVNDLPFICECYKNIAMWFKQYNCTPKLSQCQSVNGQLGVCFPPTEYFQTAFVCLLGQCEHDRYSS